MNKTEWKGLNNIDKSKWQALKQVDANQAGFWLMDFKNDVGQTVKLYNIKGGSWHSAVIGQIRNVYFDTGHFCAFDLVRFKDYHPILDDNGQVYEAFNYVRALEDKHREQSKATYKAKDSRALRLYVDKVKENLRTKQQESAFYHYHKENGRTDNKHQPTPFNVYYDDWCYGFLLDNDITDDQDFSIDVKIPEPPKPKWPLANQSVYKQKSYVYKQEPYVYKQKPYVYKR